MGYHKVEIEKGELGEFSKIREEFEELQDAVGQDDSLLILCELSDLYGAMEEYLKKWNLNMNALEMFSNKTKEAFREGNR
jgi:hypothetical protein|tara:strand:- start:61872 stop:62111 length:240 start_codon:yes stop_codon:yes gene_type:complete